MVEPGYAASHIARSRHRPHGLDGDVADDVDALAGRHVLDCDARRAHRVHLTDSWSVKIRDRPARLAEEDGGERLVLRRAAALVQVEDDLPLRARLDVVEVA